ncbi:uncharacterized protein LOC122370166 [Amphibalanus amphitrite]|uniref:uncharacterized protein LOC122370166 n=1 Tax=Amphibalanus amphitrite TaxID=1232801 RepID=UPI001C914E91|nr:uncharacterized protein LOC122370166 [Amphibalanus amphitrite]
MGSSGLPLPLLLMLLLMLLMQVLVSSALGWLPEGAFVVLTASWTFRNDTPPDDEVISSGTERSECDCMTECLVRDDCLSFSFGDGSCTLFNRRGNVNSSRLMNGTVPWVRYRRDMAYLGDWCSSDHDCYLLTSGEVTCWENTCSCPPGEFAQNTTICGSGRPVTGPGQFTTTEPTETSSSHGEHQSPPAVTTETTSRQFTTGPTASSTGPPTETSSQANTTVQSTTVTVATTETTTSVESGCGILLRIRPPARPGSRQSNPSGNGSTSVTL